MGLFLTACAVLLLPLLYITTVGLAAAGSFTLIRHADSLFVDLPHSIRMTIVYVVAFFLLGMVVGLLKPLFAKAGAIHRNRSLKRESEPLLAAYIDRLCDALGAPRPTSIHVNCEPNAGAELRQGWLLIGQRGISLHIGLPLVAGLTLRQFTGVLAHEFGHFTQRTAMSLENTVRRTNQWFYRAAFEHDSIDEWLDWHCQQIGLAALPCRLVRVTVWLARQILLGLALAGNAISGLMSRQMEFNADRCQVRVVGTRSMATTMRRLRELSIAHEISFRDIAAFYEEGRLPDDIIALSVANISFITPKVKGKLQRMAADEVTGLFDTHPCERERIEAAMRDGSAGSFPRGSIVDQLPATVLFSRFEEISRKVTEQYYRDALNKKISSRMLHPVAKLLARQTDEIEARKALRRYFQTEIPSLRPLPIPPQSTETPDNPKEVVRELKSSRDRMLEELPNYERLVPRYQAAETTLFQTITAQIWLQAKIPFKPSHMNLLDSNLDAVMEKQTRARDGIATLAGKMLPFETEAGNRLSFAMQLLHVPQVVERIPEGDNVWFEVKELIAEGQFVSHLVSELPSLRLVFHRLLVLWEGNQGKPLNDRFLGLVSGQMVTLRSRLISIQKEMGSHLYPFDHARADTTLKNHVLPHVPDEHDLGGLLVTAEQLQSRLINIQSRIFARLARAAEKVERALGLPPLSEPDNDTGLP